MESTAINTVYLVFCETADRFVYVDKVYADERKAKEHNELMNEIYRDTDRRFWIEEETVY